MNVEQLRAKIADLPGHMPVIQASDPEGNGFSPLDEVERGLYCEADGEMVHPDDAFPGLVEAICLWPGY